MLKQSLVILLHFAIFVGCDTRDERASVESIVIEATGDDFNWYFRYPGYDGILGNEDDLYSVQNLFLPDHANVKLELASNDYLYTFALPEIGLKEIAVPGLSFELEFQTKSARVMQLLGDQFCGFSHDSLKGKVHVLNQERGFYYQDGEEFAHHGFYTSLPY